MKFQQVTSHEDFISKSGHLGKTYLMLIRKGSSISDCAFDNLSKVENDDIHLFVADVSEVRDIHERYGIKTLPSLLSFSGGEFQNVVKGCNNPEFYQSFFENTALQANADEESRQPSVTVYTTPTCSWCNTLKSHLRKHKIHFTEIDVAADPALAQELVRKSGQQGVPQTEINGEIIVGFDKTRINKLLNIN